MTTIGVFAVIFDSERRVLCVRRAYGPQNWTTPGGRLESGESPGAALEREVWEETGYIVQAGRLLGAYAATFKDDLVLSIEAEIIEQETGLETRVSSLDYIQRGGTPVAYDRSLATAFGVKAAELIRDKKYGEMTALKGNRITSVPLEKVADGIKTVNLNAYRIAEKFFG